MKLRFLVNPAFTIRIRVLISELVSILLIICRIHALVNRLIQEFYVTTKFRVKRTRVTQRAHFHARIQSITAISLAIANQHTPANFVKPKYLVHQIHAVNTEHALILLISPLFLAPANLLTQDFSATTRFRVQQTHAKTVQPVIILLIILITPALVSTTMFSPVKIVKPLFHAVLPLVRTLESVQIQLTIPVTLVRAPMITPGLNVKPGYLVL